MTSEMKSKVMVLGNKLAPKVGNRRNAFVQAWIIVKAGGLTLPVRGVTFGSRQEALRRLSNNYRPQDVRAVLVPEPSNPVDPAAVAVMVAVNGGSGLYRLGYVPAAMTAAARILGGQLPCFEVVEGTSRGARITLRV
ncbi:hypothetical protein FACS189479_05120 [Spirochaetia bacterium]|nr:hypothetical protein FACS189479_05120 [Spirochaetia bacterium]